MLRINLILVFILFAASQLTGQNPAFFGLKSHYGFIIPHSSELKNISNSNPWGLQIEYSKLKLDQKSWDKCNCYAQTGLSFTYFNFQNPSQLGSSYNLVYFAEPLLTYKKKLFYSFRVGIGVSYLDTIFDLETNPENTFFGSSLSFLLLTNFNINYRLSPRYIISATANYNHISNGGSKQPNKGMNFPTFGIGFSYSPENYSIEERSKNSLQKGQLKGYARLFGTMPEVSNEDIEANERKLLIGLTGGALYYLTHTNAINLGVELINNQAIKAESYMSNQSYDHKLVALTLGHNFVFGKITFNQQMGWYLYKPFPSSNKHLFQRYELLYQLGQRYQVGTSLKAHGSVAENFDIRFGITF